MEITRRDALKMASSAAIVGGPSAATAHDATAKAVPQGADLEFDLGIPTPDTVEKLYDTMDFQRAVQGYLWAVPIVGMEGARRMLVDNAEARSGDLVLVAGYRDVSVMLGSNVTTPYVFAWFDLTEGPIVIDYPEGATAGSLIDWWDRPLIDVGVSGPDGGKGAKFVVVGPAHEAPENPPAGAKLLRSRTNKVLMFCRGLDSDLKKVEAVFSKTQVYPLGATGNGVTALLRFKTEGQLTSMAHPKGLAYWQSLIQALDGEQIEDRDRFFAAMLKPLGVTYGGSFSPNDRQTELLDNAANLGEAMAKASAFSKRIPGMRYREDTHWEYLIPQDFVNEQDGPDGTLLDQRTAFFYEVTGTSAAVLTKTPGTGSAYLTAYSDPDGHAFDGAKSYRLRVPANVPSKTFWSITLYDTETRGLIQNKQQIVDRSSRQKLKVQDDGSIEIVMGPQTPEGLEQNWIPTTPGKAWFVYFRLFGPLEPYFDKSWRLPDIEKAI
ncbi:DUF1254 domain-containing protein [Sinorhizobium meliloti]|nr:DUF1254 domain-containing protein [Sinorhizobium meliloti]